MNAKWTPEAEALRTQLRAVQQMVMGPDNSSDSGTETFALLLSDALDATFDDMEDSHEDGLCNDCLSSLARYLMVGR
jgi:hypothetical protein